MVTVKLAKEHTVGDDKDKKLALKKAMEEFVINNENELKKFFQFKTGICDRDMIHDAIYEFYYRIMKTEALLSFGQVDEGAVYGIPDGNGGVRKRAKPDSVKMASFETYITNQLCWMMPVLSKQNFRHKHTLARKGYVEKYVQNDIRRGNVQSNRITMDYSMVTCAPPLSERTWVKDTSVFEVVSNEHAYYKVCSAYETSLFDDTIDPAASGYIENFKNYIRSTETPKMAEKMITYLDHKLEGCKGVMIATMIKSSKKGAEKKVGVSNNMVKIIRQNLQRKFVKWHGSMTVA